VLLFSQAAEKPKPRSAPLRYVADHVELAALCGSVSVMHVIAMHGIGWCYILFFAYWVANDQFDT
jgi:hypothetical protein